MSTIKAAVNTYSHAPLTASDWVWRAADLAALRTVPFGAVVGAPIGASYGKFLETKGDQQDVDLLGYASVGSLAGMALGATVGAPGIFRYAGDAIKLSRAATTGFSGNTLFRNENFTGQLWNL